MPDFKKNSAEYMHTVPLAGLLAFGITVILGSLLCLKFEGILFGIAAIFFPVITGGVVNLVFNPSMKAANFFCFTLGGFSLFLVLAIDEAFFVFFIGSLIIWGVIFYKKFEEI